MISVIESIIPVILVIATGWLTRVTGFISETHWNGVERVTYYVLIPALMIFTLSMTDLSQVPIGKVGIVLLAPVIAISCLMLALRPAFMAAAGVDGPAFTSVFQGAIRWNSFVALGIASTLHGKVGLAYCAVAFAVLIPFANFASIIVLTRYGSASRALQIGPFLVTLIKNPFIWSTLTGIAINLIGLPMPKIAASYTDILGRAALATGLLMVGAGLDIRSLQRPGLGLVISGALKLVALPVMTGTLGLWLGLTGAALAVPMICAAVPTAAASYILAKQHGGDAPLMAAIITAQTIAAAVTMPVMLMLFQG